MDITNLTEILIIINFVGIILYLILFLNISQIHQSMDKKIRWMPQTINSLDSEIKSMNTALSNENKDLRGRETEVVIEEAKKISQLWKTRKEQLQMGYWEKMEARADELNKLHEQKAHIEELIKRTKLKYHKREIDEESFREIVKDYQKQLMEINVKIWELEKALG